MDKGRARGRAAQDMLTPEDLRLVRQRAMKALYAMDATGKNYQELSLDGLDEPDAGTQPRQTAVEGSDAEEEVPAAPQADRQALIDGMARRLVTGSQQHWEEIDTLLADYAQRWKVDRLPKVDLAILRLGLYELTWCEDIPPGATINECVELAKEYSTAKSGAFINGILGNHHRALGHKPGAADDEPTPSCSD